MKRIIPVLVVSVIMFTIFVDFVYSQNQLGSGTFNKKSISIVPVTSPSFTKYHDQMMQGLVYMEKSAQYDFNFVSKNAINKFQDLFVVSNYDYNKPESPENVTILTNMLRESGILTEIIRTSVNYDTVLSRYEKSLKKEREQGNNAGLPDDADKGASLIVSNTYIGIPIYTNYDTEAKGKLIWLKFVNPTTSDWNKKLYKRFVPAFNDSVSCNDWSIDADKIVLKRVGVKSVSLKPGSDLLGLSIKERMNIDLEKNLLPQEAGARIIIRSMLSYGETLEDFKQRGTLQESTPGGSLGLDFGLQEGVYLDQGFKVYEQESSINGKSKYRYAGFIRVNKVADNRVKTDKVDALSDYYSIIPGSFQKGYSAVSHPQFLDISLKAGYKNIYIPKEVFGGIFKDNVTNVFNGELNISYNLARVLKITQLFAGLSGSYGLPMSTSATTYTYTPSIIDAEIFLQKKFWLQRFNLSIAAFGGTSIFSISGTDALGDVKVKTDGLTYSVGGRASLEFAISADLNLAVDAGYKYVLAPTAFKITYGGTDYTFNKTTDSSTWSSWKLDDLKLGGLNFGLRFTYSIPKL